MNNCKPVNSPMLNDDGALGSDVEDLKAHESRLYRGATALLSYLSQDRPDLSAAVTHLAKGMSKPTNHDFEKLRRAVRFVKGCPRLVQLMVWQPEVECIELFTDSDWANCKNTRKSHSGGCIFMNQHLISHWCRIQPSIAYSSGEAELFSGNVGLSRSIGHWNTLRELRGNTWGNLRHHVDASACKAILMRKGSGSIKHLEVKDLWAQKVIRDKGISVVKIPRELNVADALASYSNHTDLFKQVTRMGFDVREEEAKSTT